jgi:hypothetical protein
LIDLKKNGKGWFGLCPFHPDKFNPARLIQPRTFRQFGAFQVYAFDANKLIAIQEESFLLQYICLIYNHNHFRLPLWILKNGCG